MMLIAGLVASLPTARPGGAQEIEKAGNRVLPNRTDSDDADLQDQIKAAAVAARDHMEQALESDVAYVRSDALREARKLDESWIAELALPRCESPDLTERSIALEVVSSSDPSMGREAFLEALESDERNIRLRGLLGLEQLADEGTVNEVVEILRNDPDPDVREVAARTLGVIGSDLAHDALIEALDSDHPALREQAVLSLVAIGDGELGELLLERLDATEFPGEVNLLRMLALIPDPALVPRIKPFVHHSSEEVETSAAAAILTILERSGYTH
jgi:HEAT repeat protein